MMHALDPTTFTVSTSLVGLVILLIMIVSRPGLAEDRGAWTWWIVGEVFYCLHNFIMLLLTSGTPQSSPGRLVGLATEDIVAIDFACLILSLSFGVTCLRALCQTPLSMGASITLLTMPALLFMLLMRLVSWPDGRQLLIIAFAGGLTMLQIAAAWPGLSQSLGLRILTTVNGVIVLLVLVGLSQVLASMAWGAPASPLEPGGAEFRPNILGMLCDLVASISTAFSLSLVMQERQRAFIIRLSTTDALTGAFNRRGAMPLMTQALNIAHRRAESCSIALLDIDHFKQVNDRLGHEAGDAVLRAFADIITAGKRECDLLARWGGEEFLLLLPGTDHAVAQATLERLRKEMPSLVATNAPCAVTFSAGIVTIPPLSIPAMLDRIIDHADRCLYRAKLTRDCVVAETATQAPENRMAA